MYTKQLWAQFGGLGFLVGGPVWGALGLRAVATRAGSARHGEAGAAAHAVNLVTVQGAASPAQQNITIIMIKCMS